MLHKAKHVDTELLETGIYRLLALSQLLRSRLGADMITADNLNLDVLEQIFHSLSEHDLPSIALVNQSFSAAVVSRLYKSISFRLRHSKGYLNGETMSPFAVIVSHPRLAVYVRHIYICSLPHLKSAPHPVFMRECRDALQLCNNMTTFKYTAAVPYFLSTLIPSLLNKTRLKDLHLHCNISSSAAKLLERITHLTNLSLEFASWNVTQILLPWMASMSTTLNSLTLYMINDLREDVFRDTIRCLPNLRGLHVVGCSKLDHSAVLNQVIHTPFLESLSVTTTPDNSPIPDFLFSPTPPLRHLKHLALDSRFILQPLPTPSSFATVLRLLKPSAPPLTSFSLKLPEKKLELNEEVITQLIENHAFTLRRLAFIDCGVGPESIEKICLSCIHLEELALSVPTKELLPFAQRLSQSTSLHTLIDLENHIDHGVRIPIDRDSARYLMSLSKSLRKVVTTTDIFLGKMIDGFVVIIPGEKPSQHAATPLWFIPERH